MAETHKPPEKFTLRMRRYDPESGEAPYWDEHTIELEPHRSVLEGILQAKAKFDGSIGIRCSCRAAICGSCGVRINGEPVAKWNVPRYEQLMAHGQDIVFTFLNGADEMSKRLKISDLVP